MFLIFFGNGKKKNIFLAGFLLCAGFLTRPNILGLLPVFILFLYYTRRRKFIIYFCAGFISLFSLLLIRNALSSAPLLSFEDTGPIAFVTGNYYPSTGDKFYYPGDSQKVLNSNSNTLELLSKTYKSHPNFFSIIKLFAYKLYSIFACYESPNNYSFYFQRNFNYIFYIPLLADILAPLFFCGLTVLYFQKKINFNLIFTLTVIVVYCLAIIAFYVISRFRIPLYPLYIIISAYLILHIKELPLKKIIISSFVFLVFLIVLNLNRNQIKHGIPQYYCNIGFFYFNDISDDEKAAEYFRKTIEIEKSYPKAYYGLAAIANKYGKYSEAARYLNECIKYEPDSLDAYSSLGLCYFKEGNYSEAKKNYEVALKLSNFDPQLLSNYGGLLIQMQSYYEAEKIMTTVYKLTPKDASVLYNFAVLNFKLNKFSEAIKYLYELQAQRALDAKEKYLFDLLTKITNIKK